MTGDSSGLGAKGSWGNELETERCDLKARDTLEEVFQSEWIGLWWQGMRAVAGEQEHRSCVEHRSGQRGRQRPGPIALLKTNLFQIS